MSEELENGMDSIETQSEELAPAVTPEVAKAIEKMERDFMIKVNGKEQKATIDLNDHERIKKALQLEAASGEAFQSAAAMRKQQTEMENNLAEFIEELKSNPLAVLQHEGLGVDVRKMVEAYLQAEIDRSQKSPEQLQLEEAQAQLAQYQEEKKAMQEANDKAKQQMLNQEAAQQLEAEITDVIEKGGLPKSKYISQKLTDLAYIAYSNGVDLSIAEIAPLVKKQYLEDMKDMLGISSDEIVEGLLGKERIRAMRNKQLQAVKAPGTAPKDALKTQDTGSNSSKKEEPQKLRAKDFFKGLSG